MSKRTSINDDCQLFRPKIIFLRYKNRDFLNVLSSPNEKKLHQNDLATNRSKFQNAFHRRHMKYEAHCGVMKTDIPHKYLYAFHTTTAAHICK